MSIEMAKNIEHFDKIFWLINFNISEKNWKSKLVEDFNFNASFIERVSEYNPRKRKQKMLWSEENGGKNVNV